jgi:hypothetical protein
MLLNSLKKNQLSTRPHQAVGLLIAAADLAPIHASNPADRGTQSHIA